MKVLNVNQILETSGGGGTAERTLQMSFFLAENGIDCRIITTDVFLTPKTKKYLEKVNILALPCLSKRFYIPKPDFFKVNRIVKSSDIIHLMNHWTFINAWIYLNLRWHKKPYVICPAGALPLFGRSKIIKKIYNWIIGKKIIQNANYCIAVTKDEIPQFLSYGVSEEKVKVIPNGVFCRPESPKDVRQKFLDKYNLGKRPFIFFIGRLNPIKGPDLLIQAFEQIKDKFPEYDLVIAGPDEGLLTYLENFIEKFHLKNRVKIIGSLQGDEKESAYQEASILVIPSRQEAMSIVILEAGIYGTPAVFTDQCGLSELSKLGYGVEVPVSVDGLAKGIQFLLSEQSRRITIKDKLKNYVYDNYDWKNIVNLYTHLYREILENGTHH